MEDLTTWRCPECGCLSYYWRFTAPDGTVLAAPLPTLPDMSQEAIATAKQKVLTEHEAEKR